MSQVQYVDYIHITMLLISGALIFLRRISVSVSVSVLLPPTQAFGKYCSPFFVSWTTIGTLHK